MNPPSKTLDIRFDEEKKQFEVWLLDLHYHTQSLVLVQTVEEVKQQLALMVYSQVQKEIDSQKEEI